jgi:transposase-like protein
MTSPIPTPTIDLIGDMYARLRDSGRRIDAEHRIQKAERLRLAEEAFDDLVLQALNEGATISKISREMGTSNRARVYQSRDRALARRAA